MVRPDCLISTDLVITGSLLAAAALAFVVLILSRQEQHTRLTGTLLLAAYGLFYFLSLLV